MRRFHFCRYEDISGISGTGVVCEGVQFHDGQVAVCWRTKIHSIEIWPHIEDFIDIHGHGSRGRVEWVDEEGSTDSIPSTLSGECGCDGPTRIDPNCKWHGVNKEGGCSHDHDEGYPCPECCRE